MELVVGKELVQQAVGYPGIWLGHGVQEVPQWFDVTEETLALCLCDQGKLEVGEVVGLLCDGCKQEAGEARWMCDPCLLEAYVLDLASAPSAGVTLLFGGLVSVAVHGFDQLL